MIISIIIAKIVALVLRIFGKGATTLPGKIALKLKYNILNPLSKGVHIICVTGTNGKTTTCALIEHILKTNNASYFINKSGANMLTGVTTAFVMNSTIFGRCKKEYAILECDENSLPLISRYIDAEIVVVTNVFRDQLDRYGEVDYTLSKIKQGIDYMPDATLVLNADCPLTFSLSRLCDNKFITFGINANLSEGIVSDNDYCPFCMSRLDYSSRVFAQLGSYICPSCGYKREKPDFCVNEIISVSDIGSTFLLNNILCDVSIGGIYNIYNAVSAIATMDYFGISGIRDVASFCGAFGRMERFSIGNRYALMLLVKNPVGLSNCIRYSSNIKGSFNAVFALNDNSADGKDVSWIWDSNFSNISYKCISVTTIGNRAYDMALRLKYDRINVDRIIDGEDYQRLVDLIKQGEGDYIIFSTYTSMMKMRHYFVDAFGGKEFWE